MSKYEYTGAVKGQLIERAVRECAAVAGMYSLPATDFDDVVHDAMLALLTKQRFDENRGVKLWTYMKRIVRSAAHDSCQRRDVAQCDACQEHCEHITETAPQEMSHDMQRLRLMVQRLPDDYRTVIVLRFGLRGGRRLTVDETAVRLNVSPRTVKRWQAAGFSLLKIWLEVDRV